MEKEEVYNSHGSKPPRKPMAPGVVVVCVLCGMIMFIGFWHALFSSFFGALFSGVGLESSTYTQSEITGDTLDVIYVEGTIEEGGSNYQHNWTLSQIDNLMNISTNKGIFLYVNSPGGGIYESDELYLKLKEYKEVTGRPVYAYMAQTAASGGLYITMAADKIFANRMTMTGSIGVIMALTDTTGLQNLIGIKTENITSGPNKAMGNPLTEEQRKILQSMVDESYDIFVSIVAENRNLDEAKVREIADGRVYSALQAKELGLIDEVMGYDEALQEMINTYNLEECTVYHQSPPTTIMDDILSSLDVKISGNQSKVLENFTAVNEYIKAHQSPKLMYYMQN